jgi:hypothetical protein
MASDAVEGLGPTEKVFGTTSVCIVAKDKASLAHVPASVDARIMRDP